MNDLYKKWSGHSHVIDIEQGIYDSAQMQDFAGYCVAELESRIAELEAENAEVVELNKALVNALEAWSQSFKSCVNGGMKIDNNFFTCLNQRLIDASDILLEVNG